MLRFWVQIFVLHIQQIFERLESEPILLLNYYTCVLIIVDI